VRRSCSGLREGHSRERRIRGDEPGDVVAYLPKQRVVATGDLLHGWMPFMGDAFPKEWVATLDALDKLDFDNIIGGHGGVKPKAHLRFFRNYIADLIEEVGRARQRGETLEQAQRSAASALQPKYEAGMDGRFAGSIGANIEKVYKDMAAGLY
jgi:glyoxylase-like metal-dependent hydrolase (beta-lactamase superfamily II)